MPAHLARGRAPRGSRRTLLALAIAACLLTPTAPGALAASPSPGPVAAGDTRSEGEGAGLVGAPLLAAAGVVALGLVVAGVTVAFARLRGLD